MSKYELDIYNSIFLKKCIVTIKEEGYPERREVIRKLEDIDHLMFYKPSKSVIEEIKNYLDSPLEIARNGVSIKYKNVNIIANSSGLITNTNLQLLKDNIRSYQDIRRFVENVFRVPMNEDSDIIYQYSVDVFHMIMKE